MLTTRIISGYILLKTGLHIGGSDAGVKIGGIDNPVIKNPITNMPYIPGSSLKGKMRFLLEHYYGLEEIKETTDRNGRVTSRTGEVSNINTRPLKPNLNWKKNYIADIFGYFINDTSSKDIYPTRAVFRDSNIYGGINDAIDKTKILSLKTILENTNTYFVEGKYEVAIDRLTGSAKGGALRQIERVPAGTLFDFEIVLRVFDETEADEHLQIIYNGMKLLENDALGGYGSRGSGRIKFMAIKENGKEAEKYTQTVL